MPSVAFVTYREQVDVAPDDRLVADALRRRGVEVKAVVWDDPTADWSRYDVVVIRSCWDYFHDPERFRSWLQQLETSSARVFNPLPIVRWNHDKAYLRDLEERGIEIAPTYWCSRENPPLIHNVLVANNWSKAVVKPTISGTSMLTWIVNRADCNSYNALLAELLLERDMMIQEYMPEIEQGEWSLIFFDGQFSHAAVKRAKPGDFRVQDEHGGTWSQEAASASLISQGRKILECVPETLLYARVDGILRQDRFLLMELELIEPMLYFGENQAAADAFAEKIVARL